VFFKKKRLKPKDIIAWEERCLGTGENVPSEGRKYRADPIPGPVGRKTRHAQGAGKPVKLSRAGFEPRRGVGTLEMVSSPGANDWAFFKHPRVMHAQGTAQNRHG
jgi:hypothetical protein